MSADDRPGDDRAADGEFGPAGYLPERAARRARKIVLREQMGLQWPIAAIVAAVVVALAGTWYLLYGRQPPPPPFLPLVEIEDIDPRGAQVLPAGTRRSSFGPAPRDLIVIRAGGGVRVFHAPSQEVAWCAESGRVEGLGGAVWNTNGRLVGGPGRSLRPVPSEVFDGTLYVNADAGSAALPPEDAGERPACAG